MEPTQQRESSGIGGRNLDRPLQLLFRLGKIAVGEQRFSEVQGALRVSRCQGTGFPKHRNRLGNSPES